MDARVAEVMRTLDRYMVEIVEAFELCPWAKSARLAGELAVDVLWQQPVLDAWVAAGQRLLARGRVAMVVAPEFAGAPRELRAIRDAVAARLPTAGVADFHPEAALDLSSPARLVPYLRRSPDPLLQLVPLALLATVRGPPPVAARPEQARILGGAVEPARGDVGDAIASVNHARVTRDADAITARYVEIFAERRQRYPQVGIAIA